MSAKPLVSVIVLNWNGKKYLKKCFESLGNVVYDNLEVIMVDNGSSDGSIKYTKENFPWVKVVWDDTKFGRNMGQAYDRNIGIKHAQGKYLVTLDNDTYVTPDFISEIVDLMEERREIGACQSKLILDDHRTLDSQGAFLTNIGFLKPRGTFQVDKQQFNSVEEVFSAKGAALSIRRETLGRVGAFDKDFFNEFEDGDLCWRIWVGGYKVVYVPTSVVYHILGGTRGIKAKKGIKPTYHFYAFRNRITSMIKNLSPKYLLRFISVHLIICLLVAAYLTFRRKPRYALGIVKAILANLRDFRNTWRKRKVVQLTRRTPDEYIIRNLTVKAELMVLYHKMKTLFISPF